MQRWLLAGLAVPLVAQAQERTPNDPRLHTPGKLTAGTGNPVYSP